MKKIIEIVVVLFVMLDVSSCDYVSQPLKPQSNTNNNSHDSNTVYKNIMVEDYTGATCVNCPPAGAELDTLIQMYGSRIVPLSVNAGNFAWPAPTYSLNLQSAVGDTYDTYFQMSATGNPCGMVNRKIFPSFTSRYLLYTQWASNVQSIIQSDTAFIKLQLSTTLDTSSRILNVSVTSTFLKSLNGAYNLVILFTQDSIIGPQKSSTLGEIPNYNHRFVLRDVVTNTWGDALVSAGSNKGQVVTKNYSYNIAAAYPTSSYTGHGTSYAPTICNLKQCSVVAYIYDATTNSPTQYEVFQSATKKIYP